MWTDQPTNEATNCFALLLFLNRLCSLKMRLCLAKSAIWKSKLEEWIEHHWRMRHTPTRPGTNVIFIVMVTAKQQGMDFCVHMFSNKKTTYDIEALTGMTVRTVSLQSGDRDCCSQANPSIYSR